MRKYNVLVIDDERDIRALIRDYFVKNDFMVFEAENGEKAIELFFSDNKIDLIILDIMMPKMNGYEVLKEIRNSSKVPVIMLTAKCSFEDESLGFELLADDYVKKPFSPKVLVHRAASILKRDQKGLENKTAGALTLYFERYDAMAENKSLNLTTKEFELLSFFVKNEGIVLSREKLLDNVWGYQYDGEPRTVDVYVKELRKKLGNVSNYIITVRGIGYKFEVEHEKVN